MSMRALILAALFATLPACSNSGNESGGTSGSSQAASGRFVGQVTETMDAGGYTYVRLARNGEAVWAAGPETTVQVGQEISIELGMKMDNFRSETLDRSFDAVYFVGALTPAGSGKRPATVQTTPSGTIDPASIEKPDGGHRVAELWENRTSLAGSEVVVRGRVVKFTPGVMGRNWIHLQDGTGDSGAGTHDITITTQDQTAVGEVVTARGTVVVDQDFGAGYAYQLLVETARLDVQ